MKFFVFILSSSLVLTSYSQLVENPKSGLYEHIIEDYDSLHLSRRFKELRLETDHDLQFKGSFSHMVKKIAPVEIRYIGLVEKDNYILTRFQLKGGISDAWLDLEEIPKKQRIKWIEIIEDKIKKMDLSD